MYKWVFVLVALAAPAMARSNDPIPAPLDDYAAMTLEELSAALDSPGSDADQCNFLLPIYTQIAQRRPDVTGFTSYAIEAEMRCAYIRRDFALAHQLLHSSELADLAVDPRIVLHIDAMAGTGEQIIAGFRKLVLESDVELLASTDNQFLFFVRSQAVEKLGTKAMNQLDAEILASDRFAGFDPALQNAFTVGALRVAESDGDLVESRRLIGTLERPEYLRLLLVDRSRALIWPIVGERAGKGFARVFADFRENALARYGANPEMTEYLNDVAHALYYAGDDERLIDLVDTMILRDDLVDTAKEDEAWALNLKGYALDRLGRRNEAKVNFELLGQIARAHPDWGVSFTINHALWLSAKELWEEAKIAADEAEESARVSGNEYARMLVRSVQVCVLAELDRAGDAEHYLETLRNQEFANATGLAEALQCLGRDDEAASVLVEALRNPDARDTTILALQPDEYSFFGAKSSRPDLNDLLATHEELRTTLLKYARVVPDEYLPQQPWAEPGFQN